MANIFPTFKNWLQGVAVSNSINSATSGNAGQVLMSNGTGNMSWTNPACSHGAAVNCSSCYQTTAIQGLHGGLLAGQAGQSGQIQISTGTAGGGTSLTIQFPTPLSDAELKELNILKEQHATESKAVKKQKFRELHPELRQMVIAMLLWQEKCLEISVSESTKTDRMKELEARHMTLSSQWFTSTVGPYVTAPPIPHGLTVQDLQEAHTEATLEEEILSCEESDSK